MNDLDLLIELLGEEQAKRFIANFGGITYAMPKVGCERATRLRQVMGDESAEILMLHFGGCREYINQFSDFMNVENYQALVDDIRQAMDKGMSKTQAIELFCPKYQVSDRFARDLLKIGKITYDKFRKKYGRFDVADSQLGFGF